MSEDHRIAGTVEVALVIPGVALDAISGRVEQIYAARSTADSSASRYAE
jgi:hypothetical protein